MKNIQLRKSSYLISIPLEETKGKYMLIHGYTGAIDIVTETLAKTLKNNIYFTFEDFPYSENLFLSLQKRGYITEKTEQEEYEYTARVADILHRSHKALYKGFTFLIAYDCNFRCPYCYEGELSNNGRQWSKKVFTKELADTAFKAMMKIEPNSKLHQNVILLYGGEPLLKENREIIEHIVNTGKEKGYSFKAITNGYDLEHYYDLLTTDQIHTLQITIDGTKEYHNQRRIHYREKNTFDRIIENIKVALDKEVEVIVRINTDATIFKELEGLKKLFNNLGYDQYKNFVFQSALLREEKPSTPDENLSYLSSKDYYKKHKEEKYQYKCQDLGGYKKIFTAIKHKKRLRLDSTYCSAQYGNYILDPYGDIYPCLGKVGENRHIIGNYQNEQIEWTEANQLWQGHNISLANKCSKCKYSFLCGGGCLDRAKYSEKGVEQSDCDNYPALLRYAANKAYHDIINGI